MQSSLTNNFLNVDVISSYTSNCLYNIPKLTCGVSYKNKASCHSVGCCWDDSNDICFISESIGYSIEFEIESDIDSNKSKKSKKSIIDIDKSTQNAFLSLIKPNSVTIGNDYEHLNLVSLKNHQVVHIYV